MATRLEALRDDRIGASAFGCLSLRRGTALPHDPTEASGFWAGNYLGWLAPEQRDDIDRFLSPGAIAKEGHQQIHSQRFFGQRAPWKSRKASPRV